MSNDSYTYFSDESGVIPSTPDDQYRNGSVGESLIHTPSKIDGSTSRIQESDLEESPIYTNQHKILQPSPINISREISASSSISDSFQTIKGQKPRMRNIIQSDSEDEPDLVNHRGRNIIQSDSDSDEPDLAHHRGRNVIQSDSEDEPDLVHHRRRNLIQSDSEDESQHNSSSHHLHAKQQNQPEESTGFKDPETSIQSTRSEAASGNSGEEEVPEIHDLSDSVVEVDQIDRFSPSMLRTRIQDLSIQDITSPEDKKGKTNTLNAIQVVRRSLEQKQSLLKSIKNLNALPDGGTKLKQQVTELENKLLDLEKYQSSSPPSDSESNPTVSDEQAPKVPSVDKQEKEDQLRKQIQMKKWALGNATGEQRARIRAELATTERELFDLVMSNSSTFQKYNAVVMNATNRHPAVQLLPEAPRMTDIQRRMFAEQPTDQQLYVKGRQTAASKREAVSVTLDALQNLHQSLATCPTEKDTEPTPSALNVPLLPHQNRSLKWLMWRETQNPAGGILADDMGLGKTLTMIALIVRQLELEPPTVSDLWLSKTLKIKKSSASLIVCPASVIGQWDKEITRRCKRNTLKVVTFHGADRHKIASKLHTYDVVLTTYQIIVREVASIAVDKKADLGPIGDFNVETQGKEIRQSVLLQIAWERIILDEAHTIRNPKSQVSQAVCRLRAARRWAVTGTPVQNKELDMYSLLRFLRVTPFDQLPVWKRWVDSSKTEQAAGRLQLLIKTLLLRRTKDQKIEGGEPLIAMPARELHTHQITLTKEENLVYQKILDFSRKALEQYIKSQEQKMREGYDRKSEQNDGKPQKNMTKQHLLVLLLRLRQACSHPALIKTMLDTAEPETMGSEAKIEETPDLDLISQMASMKLDSSSKLGEKKEEEEANFFTLGNPIFDQMKMSSKMRTVIEEVQRVTALKQKVVIVSQWTSMLDLFELHFKKLRIRCHTIAGNVTVKNRTAIVEDFNTNSDGPPIMLLSLAAGGVGLNLIGGNHLFLTDMHWNPQLEAQACDRVYRVGQIKDVHVHRLVTTGTVEERIVQLQKQKLDMASGILTGAAKISTKGLTLEDLKLLFNPAPTPYMGKASF